MYFIKDIGYIVKRFNSNESDKYITILTLDNGKIEVLAKGVRKLSSRRSPQLELLNKVSFQAVSKTKNSRLVLTEVKLLKNHSSLKRTLEHMRTLFSICELVSVLCPSYQKQKDVFELVDSSLNELLVKPHSFVIQSFQVKLLSLLGYWDIRHSFIDAADVQNFAENVMERKLKSPEFFKV